MYFLVINMNSNPTLLHILQSYRNLLLNKYDTNGDEFQGKKDQTLGRLGFDLMNLVFLFFLFLENTIMMNEKWNGC